MEGASRALCKPLAGHCSLSRQEEFWLVADPFLEED